jgi:hypothetical protein
MTAARRSSRIGRSGAFAAAGTPDTVPIVRGLAGASTGLAMLKAWLAGRSLRAVAGELVRVPCLRGASRHSVESSLGKLRAGQTLEPSARLAVALERVASIPVNAWFEFASE